MSRVVAISSSSSCSWVRFRVMVVVMVDVLSAGYQASGGAHGWPREQLAGLRPVDSTGLR